MPMTLTEPLLLTDPAGRPLSCTCSLGRSDKLQHQQSDRGTSAWGGDIGLGWGHWPGMGMSAWDGDTNIRWGHQHGMGTSAWDGDTSMGRESSASVPTTMMTPLCHAAGKWVTVPCHLAGMSIG